MEPLILHTHLLSHFDEDEFFAFCQSNKELRIERNAQQEIIIMAPAGSETDSKNSELIIELGIWNRKTKSGRVFGPSAGFTLPNGAMRSPDAAWIPNEKWYGLPTEQRKKFAPICPEFVVEMRSQSDSLTRLQAKMEEWMENGCRLAWLIDPSKEQVQVFRNTTSPFHAHPQLIETFDHVLSGEDVLEAFQFDLRLLRI